MDDRFAPLTERILGRLPGRRWQWIIAWMGLTIIRPFLVSFIAAPASGISELWADVEPYVAYALVFAYMVGVSLLATARLGGDARAVQPAMERLLPPDAHGAEVSMSAVGSTVGPLVLTLAASVFSYYEETLLHGATAAALGTPIAVLVNMPVMTLLWVLLAILRGFARLGRVELRLDDAFGDPSLGLALVGLLAFNGFVAFLVVLVPFLLISIERPRDLALGLGIAVVPIALELVALYRLHLQMVAARVRYVTWARALYATVLGPVRAEPVPAVLSAHSELVTAAEALVRRAEVTQEWPLTDRSFGIMLGIVAGVATSAFARVLLSGLGL